MAKIRSRRKSLSDSMLRILFDKKYGGKTKHEAALARHSDFINHKSPLGAYIHAPEYAMAADALRGIAGDYYGRKAEKERGEQNMQYADEMEREKRAVESANEQDYQEDVYRDQRDFNLRQQQNDQRGAYMQGMLALKKQALIQKAQAAALKSAAGNDVVGNNPFKGDPQAMSVWRSLKSAADKRAFEELYKKDRAAAFAAVEDIMKNKYGNIMGMGGLIGGKEPSGHYKMSKDPMKDANRVMSYDEYAVEVIKTKGDIPENVIRKGYDAYLKSYGLSGAPGDRSNVGRALGGI
jgi:hypothetical protein